MKEVFTGPQHLDRKISRRSRFNTKYVGKPSRLNPDNSSDKSSLAMNKNTITLLLILALSWMSCVPPESQVAANEPMTPFDFIISTIWFFLTGLMILYIMVLRPKQLGEQEHENFIKGLKKNDGVITSGGIYARVVGVRDDFVTVEIAQNVRVKVKPEDIHPSRDKGAGEKTDSANKKDK